MKTKSKLKQRIEVPDTELWEVTFDYRSFISRSTKQFRFETARHSITDAARRAKSYLKRYSNFADARIIAISHLGRLDK